MKNVMLKDWEWVINLSYRDIAVGDTELHISGLNAPDILSAIAKVYQHILDFPYTEIISIRQAKRNIETGFTSHNKQMVQLPTKEEMADVLFSPDGETESVNYINGAHDCYDFIVRQQNH